MCAGPALLYDDTLQAHRRPLVAAFYRSSLDRLVIRGIRSFE